MAPPDRTPTSSGTTAFVSVGAPSPTVTTTTCPTRRCPACFSCSESSYLQTACPKLRTRTLLVDGMELEGSDDVIIEDDILKVDILEEQVYGDTDTLLILQRSCFSLKQFADSWFRKSLFHSTYTMNDKVCHFIINSGNCENVVSEDVVRKLSLKSTCPHTGLLG